MKRILLILLAVIIIVPTIVIGLDLLRDPGSDEKSVPIPDAADQLARGRYLALAGDCMACHTMRGGKAYAGGRVIRTPFGDLFSPNITPDAATGIGKWTAEDFWRALHNGKSRDGSLLYPAFPYPNYTKVTRADSDAIFAYLKTLEPVQQMSKEHALRFPYNQRILLAGWRALYFRPGVYRPEAARDAQWNRGAYLVQGLGHCSACHTSRNALGAPRAKADLAGGMIPMQNWYASSLTAETGAGLGNWEVQHIAELLKNGVSEKGTAFGPMAEVVRQSLQHLSDQDLTSMAVYLKSLPKMDTEPLFELVEARKPDVNAVLALGAKVYDKHCMECHKANGQGIPPAYPPLAGNRSLLAPSAINPIRIVLNGGFPPSTAGNPRPYGMQPFSAELNDNEIAAVVSYVRNSWGNSAGFADPEEVARFRGAPAE